MTVYRTIKEMKDEFKVGDLLISERWSILHQILDVSNPEYVTVKNLLHERNPVFNYYYHMGLLNYRKITQDEVTILLLKSL